MNNRKRVSEDINYIDELDLKELIERLQKELDRLTQLGHTNITATSLYETLEISYDRDKTEAELENDRKTAEFRELKELETYERLKAKFEIKENLNNE